MDEAPESPQASNRSVWLILSYLWIAACCVALPIIPMIMEREDSFAKWHAKHGFILGMVWLVLSVILLVIANVMGMLDWNTLQTMVYMLWGFVGACFLVLCLVAMMKGFEGQCWTIKPLQGFMSKLDF